MSAQTLVPGRVYCHALPTVGTIYGGTGYAGQLSQLVRIHSDGIQQVWEDGFIAPSANNAAALEAADALGGLVPVAFELDNSVQAQAGASSATMIANSEAAIEAACAMVTPLSAHPGAARVGSRPVIVVYGAQQLAPADWASVLTTVRNAGCHPFVIGPLGANLIGAGSFPGATVSAYIANWDAVYSFLPVPSGYRSALLALVASAGKPYIDCAMPQYTRAGATYSQPPDGGATYTAQWTQLTSDHAQGAVVTTWNDAPSGDGSGIAGTSVYESITKTRSQTYRSAFAATGGYGRRRASDPVSSPSATRKGGH